MHLTVKEPVDVHPGQKPGFHPTNGREGETAALLSRRLFDPKLRGGGFAPRHLSRSDNGPELRQPRDFRMTSQAYRHRADQSNLITKETEK